MDGAAVRTLKFFTDDAETKNTNKTEKNKERKNGKVYSVLHQRLTLRRTFR